MPDKFRTRERYGEAFWRKHHEAWQQSALNQREYCEAHGIPLKAFGNWRAKFKAEPQPVSLKLLYRRGGLNHSLSHMTKARWCRDPFPQHARVIGAAIFVPRHPNQLQLRGSTGTYCPDGYR